MSQLTINHETPTLETAAEYLRYLEDAAGGRDRTDETRRTPRVCIPDAVPGRGPRGGIRRYTTVCFRDDVCEDVDVEDMMIARLDGPGDGDDDEREWHDHERDDEEPSDPGYEPEDDDRIMVNGLDLDTYLAYVGEGRRDGLNRYDAKMTSGEAQQDELERGARPCTRKGRWPYRLRNKSGNRHRAFKVVRCGGRGKVYYAKRRVGVPHNKPTGDSQRHETFMSRLGGTSVRTEAFDRMGDVDPWTTRDLIPSWEEHDERQDHEEEYLIETEASYCDAARFDWDNISVVLRQLRDLLSEYFWGEGDAFYATFGHGLDIAVHCWAAGMSDQETYNLLEQLVPALIPDPLTPAEEVDSREFDPIDEVWDIESPRESGEFGRATPLLEDDFDDLRPYQRLAAAAEAERDPSFLRRRSN